MPNKCHVGSLCVESSQLNDLGALQWKAVSLVHAWDLHMCPWLNLACALNKTLLGSGLTTCC